MPWRSETTLGRHGIFPPPRPTLPHFVPLHAIRVNAHGTRFTCFLLLKTPEQSLTYESVHFGQQKCPLLHNSLPKRHSTSPFVSCPSFQFSSSPNSHHPAIRNLKSPPPQKTHRSLLAQSTAPLSSNTPHHLNNSIPKLKKMLAKMQTPHAPQHIFTPQANHTIQR